MLDSTVKRAQRDLFFHTAMIVTETAVESDDVMKRPVSNEV